MLPTRSSSQSATSIGGPVSSIGRTRRPRAARLVGRVVRVEDDGEPGVVQRLGDRRGRGHRTGDPDPAGAVRAQVGDQPDRVVRGVHVDPSTGPGPQVVLWLGSPDDHDTSIRQVYSANHRSGRDPGRRDGSDVGQNAAVSHREAGPGRYEGGEGGVGSGARGGEVAGDRLPRPPGST